MHRFIVAATTLLLVLAVAFGPQVPLGEAQASGSLVVTMEGLRNDTGRVRGALYDQADTWLDHDHAAASCSGAITHGRARCVFRRVPAGTVAFAGLHDEDGNGDMNRDAVGIPTEGYAFSNDVRPTVTPPSFESAVIPPSSRRIVVHAHYGI